MAAQQQQQRLLALASTHAGGSALLLRRGLPPRASSSRLRSHHGPAPAAAAAARPASRLVARAHAGWGDADDTWLPPAQLPPAHAAQQQPWEAAAQQQQQQPWAHQQHPQPAQWHSVPHTAADYTLPAPLDAAATLERVLDVVRSGNLDGLLEFCPDEVIDRLVAMRKEMRCADISAVRFEDVLQYASDPELLLLDTFAVRNLIMAAPGCVTTLSAMQVSPERYLQRCAIVSPSGEECVLTITVVKQDCLECQYRGPPLLFKRWMLRSVTGECGGDELLPAHPSPSFPPEAVVEAQLAALRECRVGSVFAHASPQNKAATGPVQRFAALLADSPLYAPLMGHVAARTVQRLQPSESTYMEVVEVTPRSSSGSSSAGHVAGVAAAGAAGDSSADRDSGAQAGEPLLYMWIVSRQPGSSSFANCWMTDAVQMVNVLPAQPHSSSSL